jgi:hypothetical protein
MEAITIPRSRSCYSGYTLINELLSHASWRKIIRVIEQHTCMTVIRLSASQQATDTVFYLYDFLFIDLLTVADRRTYVPAISLNIPYLQQLPMAAVQGNGALFCGKF